MRINSILILLLVFLFGASLQVSFAQRHLTADTAQQIKLLESGKASKAEIERFIFTVHTADLLEAPNLYRLMDVAISAAQRTGDERLQNLARLHKIYKSRTPENRDATVKNLETIRQKAAKAGDDTLQALAHYFIIRTKGQTISTLETTKEVYKCINEFKRLGMVNFEIRSRMYYTMMYGYSGTPERTLQLYSIPLTMARKHGDSVMLSVIQNNKANIFNNKAMYDSALVVVSEAERMSGITGAKTMVYTSRVTRAEVYYNMGKYKECLALCDSLEAQHSTGFAVIGIGLWKLRGISLGKVGRYAEQEKYCSMAIEETRRQGLLLERDNIWLALAKAQIMQGKHEEAIKSLDSSKAVGGIYYALTISQQMNEAEAKLNSAEQKYKINQLEAERQSQTRINYLLVVVLILAALLLVVGIILGSKLYRGRKALQLQNELIEAQNLQLSTLNSNKDKIMGIIAHDLRSPLASLSSLSMIGHDMITEGTKAELHELFDHITSSATNLNNLVNNLFNWAVSLDGNLAVRAEPVPVQGLVEKVTDLYADKAREKKIALNSLTEASATVFGDANSVLTVVRNLVNNALKFTPECGSVSIGTSMTDHNCTITVADTGKGMTAEQLEGLTRTERAKHTSGTAGEPGSGLGMLIVKELVALNGGRMTVASSLGHGTEISIILPRTEADVPAIKPTPETVISISNQLPNRKSSV